MTVSLPRGFRAHVTNVGIKDATDDFTLVVADTVCSAAGMFTQSRFAGPSVVLSREHIANHKAKAVVVISKNATLIINGEINNKVTIEGDRLEPQFREIPGQWGAIWLRAGSKNNSIKNTIIGTSTR